MTRRPPTLRLRGARIAGRGRTAWFAAAVAAGLAWGSAPLPSAAQDIGARLAACGACHGPDGNAAMAAVPSLAGQPALFIENQLVMIREGLRDIPQMKGLLDGMPDAEVGAIAAHYARQPPKPAPASPRDPARFERGRQQAEALRCASCHQADYRGRDQMPRLAAQREDYLLHSMRDFQSNRANGRDTIMAATLYGVSAADLDALAHFLAHSPP